LRSPSHLCSCIVGKNQRTGWVIICGGTEQREQIPACNLASGYCGGFCRLNRRKLHQVGWWRRERGDRRDWHHRRVGTQLPRRQSSVDIARQVGVLGHHVPAHSNSRLNNTADRARRRPVERPHRADRLAVSPVVDNLECRPAGHNVAMVTALADANEKLSATVEAVPAVAALVYAYTERFVKAKAAGIVARLAYRAGERRATAEAVAVDAVLADANEASRQTPQALVEVAWFDDRKGGCSATAQAVVLAA